MGKRYTYARTIVTPEMGPETFTAVEFDSFEEAKNAVEKGIYDHTLELEAKRKAKTNQGPAASTVGAALAPGVGASPTGAPKGSVHNGVTPQQI